jgi:hypothetical protein
MSAPNIANVAAMIGHTKGQAVTDTLADLLENSAASGKVLKVDTLVVSNVDGANNADVTVTFVDATGPTTYTLAFVVTVPDKAALIVIDKNTSVYLEEGDKLQVQASDDNDLEVVVTWAELDD